MKVRFIHRPVCPVGGLVRRQRDRPPEVRQVAIQVVDCLDAGSVRAGEKDSQAAGERLDVIRDVAKAVPDEIRYQALTAETMGKGL